ncbi:MAG TPA: S41 family peptidase [Bryobacteraceae bacterium]|jgi:hypothetical protein
MSMEGECAIGVIIIFRVIRLLMAFGGISLTLQLAAPQSLDGVWRSRGYGYVFSIQGAVLTEFEVTSSTCVQGFTARRKPVQGGEWADAFRSKDEGTFFVRTGGTKNHRSLHQEDSVPDIQVDRVPALPAVCDPPIGNTPMANFDVFTRTWAKNYISFELRRVNWDKVVAEYRSQVTAQTTPAQLFEIFESMIKPLGDLHSYIGAPALKRSTPNFWRTGTDRIINKSVDHFADHGRWTLFAMTNRAYLQSSPRLFCRRHLQYGHIDGTTGYLRILSFGGYSRHNDLRALESALDKIFSDRQLRALVIDVRLCFGGSDELGLAIAGRLATREYVAYSVQARSDPLKRDQWTAAQPIVIRPSTRPGFRGPVVELIGPITMSAAETFSEVLMGRTPHVTRIGENTQGVFCDILDRHLPNGWTFGLPNAVYRIAEGEAFDVKGIPPDLEAPVFADADVAEGKDPAMAEAIRILSSRNVALP